MDDTINRIFGGISRRIISAKDVIRGFEYIGHAGRVPSSLTICRLDTCRECGKTGGPRATPRIIYLLPAVTVATGGVKVSYQQCGAIARSGSPCVVFHPERPQYVSTWFGHDVQTLSSGHIDPRTDFLVFTEVWAAIASEFCVPAGIRYAIFVQNGYLTGVSAGYPYEALRAAYEHADLVLSISEDTTSMIKVAFPFVPDEKLLRIVLSIPKIFSPGIKEPLITYMPRKLPLHSERMTFLMREHLPAHWRIQPIQKLDERGVAQLLGRSSIFLSFSDMEGFGLPPAEAALAGNVVVGYTGEAGKEFFRPPLFREVAQGDFRRYVEQIVAAIRDVDGGMLDKPDYLAQRRALADTYSVEAELRSLSAFVARAHQTLVKPSAAPAVAPAH